MAKKELLLGAVAAGLLLSGAAAPAFAAKGEGKHHQRHAAMFERLDTDKNGKVSLDEFKAKASAAFKAFDADGNGAVTKDEVKARHAALKDARKAVRDAADADKDKAREALRAAGPYWLPSAGKMFDRADTDKNGTLNEAEVLASAEAIFQRRDSNKDGKISQNEMLARATQTFQRFDADKNGEVTKAEVDAKREAFRDARKAFRAVKASEGEARDAALRDARMDRMGSRMFERADADKNGTLTKAEMETAAADMFKKRDRNGDGFITADEIGKRHKK